MKINCPKCGLEVGAESINVNKGIAKCDCGEVFGIGVPGAGVRPAEKVPKKPGDTKVEIEKAAENEMHVWIPPNGFKWVVIILIVMLVFWASFAISWARGTAEAGTAFALFSIPLYLSGIFIVFSGLYFIFAKSSIHINPLGLVFAREFFGIKRRKVAPLEAIIGVSSKQMTRINPLDFLSAINISFQQGQWHQGNSSRVPRKRVITIEYGTKRIEAGQNLSEAECDWLAWEIRQFVDNLRGSSSS